MAKYETFSKFLQLLKLISFSVNELTELIEGLIAATKILNTDGILILVSFHSLEDRKVKYAFLNDNRLERITRKPIVATESETQMPNKDIETEISQIINNRQGPYWNKTHPDHDKTVQQVLTLREMIDGSSK